MGGEYGVAATDPRHRAVFNGIWEAPYGLQVSGVYFYGSVLRFTTSVGGDPRGQAAGGENRFRTTAKPGWFLFDGLVKHDLETGASQSLAFGDGRFGSEAPFAPRVGAVDEDDGYLVSFITDLGEDRSECVVVDAKDIAAGPVCRILLPHRISSGTHACWAGREMLAG